MTYTYRYIRIEEGTDFAEAVRRAQVETYAFIDDAPGRIIAVQWITPVVIAFARAGYYFTVVRQGEDRND